MIYVSIIVLAFVSACISSEKMLDDMGYGKILIVESKFDQKKETSFLPCSFSYKDHSEASLSLGAWTNDGKNIFLVIQYLGAENISNLKIRVDKNVFEYKPSGLTTDIETVNAGIFSHNRSSRFFAVPTVVVDKMLNSNDVVFRVEFLNSKYVDAVLKPIYAGDGIEKRQKYMAANLLREFVGELKATYKSGQP